MPESATAAAAARFERGRETPLVETGPAEGPVTLSELALPSIWNLRLDPENPPAVEICQRLLGLELPRQANRSVRDGDRRVCWLGPDEWLLIGPDGAWSELAADLGRELEGHHHALTDIGSGHALIRLEGDLAPALLARGCSLDLHHSAFTLDACAQTHVARAQVLLIKVDQPAVFELLVRRSFADYLWRWMAHVNGRILAAA